MRISADSIARVRERVDIVGEIGVRVPLRRAGANHVGLCPFHGEKSPSFTVSATKQFFHCFGCGVNGDVIEFIMKHDGMSFAEAVQALSERVGISLEHDKLQGMQDIARARAQRERSTQLEGTCEDAAKVYQSKLQAHPHAQAYASGRGLSPETMLTYGIGYAPADGRTLDQRDSARRTLLTESGLLVESEGRYFERFRDRLMFPIRDARGRAVAFGGRLIGDTSAAAEPIAYVLAKKPAKYLNSPETAIFHKQTALYGLHEARAQIMREKMAFVVEGYMDVVMLAQHGVGNAVACMGTALTTQQLQLLLRFTDRICMVFDGDDPGRKAARKALETALPLLESHQAIRFLTLPDNQDPDEYLGQHGKDKFLEQAKVAPTLAQYLLASLVEEFGTDGQLSTPESKAQFSQALSGLLAIMRPSNRLRHIIQQEAQSVLSPAPTGKSTLSPQDRLRQFSQAGPGHFPSWRPQQPPAPPAHLQASLWSQLYDAAATAPGKAREVADQLLQMLDTSNAEESRLAGMLEILATEGGEFDTAASQLSKERSQAAADLLASAQRLIERQRTREVEEALKGMRAEGELSEQEYLRQMLALPR